MAEPLTRAERRRMLISIAQRRIRPGSGSPIEFLRARTWSEPSMALDLRALQTPFVVVGGLAANLYMPDRPTLDVGILIAGRESERISSELLSQSCVYLRPLAFGGSSWRTPDGSILDVLESEERWVEETIISPNTSPTGLPIVALPYLVLMKLDASRLSDLGDLGRMLGGADETMRDRVRDVIRRFRPDQVQDVESIIALGALEFDEG